jgi:hypothetical protein
MTQKRKTIKPHVRQLVLLEAGYRCANPSCRQILTLELHHMCWVKDGGDNSPENLLALCRNCHGLHTIGNIPNDAIAAWKGLLVALNDPHRPSADLLLVIHAEDKRVREATDSKKIPPKFRFTGDSLGSLAGLLTSGLVEISRRYIGASLMGGAHPSFEVGLTAKGLLLIEAWIAGNPHQIRIALGCDGPPPTPPA